MPVLADRPRLAKQWRWGHPRLWRIQRLQPLGDLPLMASAFRQAVEAGRKAYLSGLGRVLTRVALHLDPLTGFLRD